MSRTFTARRRAAAAANVRCASEIAQRTYDATNKHKRPFTKMARRATANKQQAAAMRDARAMFTARCACSRYESIPLFVQDIGYCSSRVQQAAVCRSSVTRHANV